MINLHIVEGRLIKDPQLRVDEKNNQVYANATLASERNYKNRNGQYDCDYIQLSLRGSEASNFAQRCFKGDLISVTGRQQTDTVTDSNGDKQYYTKNHVTQWNKLSGAVVPKEQTPPPSRQDSPFPDYNPNYNFSAELEQMTLPDPNY